MKALLRKRLEEGTLPHALLFEGVGGEAVAEELAIALLQDKRIDLHRIKPEGGSHTMAAMRELICEIHLSPYEAPCKVFLIYEAERLSECCQNALLKTLEEPPGHTYLFLLCQVTYSILSTVFSRCAFFRFSAETHSKDRAVELVRRLLAERLEYGLSGWHDLLSEIDTIEEKNELAVFETILQWARPRPCFPKVYDLVVEAHEALESNVRFRHILDALLTQCANFPN